MYVASAGLIGRKVVFVGGEVQSGRVGPVVPVWRGIRMERARMRPIAAEDSRACSGESESLGATIADAAAGDEAAWESIVSLYARRIYAMAKSRLRDAEAAEEITQSVFATLAARLREGGYEERGRFESWLFRITMNRVRDEGRRRKRRATDTVSIADHGPVAVSVGGQGGSVSGVEDGTIEALRDAVAGLEGPDREVIELRHHGQLSFAQIADLLGEPIGTVLARHHRALKKIRRAIENEGEGIS